MDRRDFLLGSACGLVTGGGLAKSLDNLGANAGDKSLLEAYPGAPKILPVRENRKRLASPGGSS